MAGAEGRVAVGFQETLRPVGVDAEAAVQTRQLPFLRCPRGKKTNKYNNNKVLGRVWSHFLESFEPGAKDGERCQFSTQIRPAHIQILVAACSPLLVPPQGKVSCGSTTTRIASHLAPPHGCIGGCPVGKTTPAGFALDYSKSGVHSKQSCVFLSLSQPFQHLVWAPCKGFNDEGVTSIRSTLLLVCLMMRKPLPKERMGRGLKTITSLKRGPIFQKVYIGMYFAWEPLDVCVCVSLCLSLCLHVCVRMFVNELMLNYCVSNSYAELCCLCHSSPKDRP